MTAEPDALRLVPVEPTLEMIEAYFGTVQRFGFHACINASTAWSAMLQAAPVSPDSDLLKEAVGLLRDLASWFDQPKYDGIWIIPAGGQGADDAVNAARAFLSKVEERG